MERSGVHEKNIKCNQDNFLLITDWLTEHSIILSRYKWKIEKPFITSLFQ
jgi:hypothetical protein